MDLKSKAAYIKGLMDGMNFDVNTNEGKLITAMYSLLEDLAVQVSEHDNAISQVYDELDAIDEDMDDLESVVFDDECEDKVTDDENVEYELTCPNCGTALTVDEETLLNDELYCPNCNASFNLESECNNKDLE